VRINEAVTLKTGVLFMTCITGLKRSACDVAVVLWASDLTQFATPSRWVKARATLRVPGQPGEATWRDRRLLVTVGAERLFVMTCLTVQTAPPGLQTVSHYPVSRMDTNARLLAVVTIKTG